MSKAVVTYAALQAPSQSIQFDSLDTGVGVDAFPAGARKAIVTFAAFDLPLSGSFTPIGSFEFGTGVDAVAAPAAILSLQTGVGTDAVAVSANSVFTISDTGGGADALSLSALLVTRDLDKHAAGGLVYLFGHQTTGRGQQTLSVFTIIAVSSADTGQGTDTNSLVAQVANADTSSGETEALAVTAIPSSLETGVAAETFNLGAVGIVSADTGTGTELYVVGQIGNPSIAESGSAAELFLIDLGVTSDTASGSETLLQAYATTVADTGTGTEPSVALSLTVTDTGEGIDVQAQGATLVTSASTGHGIDVLALGTRAPVNSFDFGGGVDSVSRVGEERNNIFIDEFTELADSLLAVGIESGQILEVE